MARKSSRSLVGQRVTVRHGFLWLRTGEGTVRATYTKEGRDFASVELDGSGKVLPRLVSQLRLAGKE
jgi:phenylpropionate dioxygenase-like ring-hydroxylating dioxygenase large terminal subunit